MRIDRKLQANIYGRDQTNSRKGQERERAGKSKFRTQGIEAEMNFRFLRKQDKRKETLKLDHFYLDFILQSTWL
jgi:hypothetical protein